MKPTSTLTILLYWKLILVYKLLCKVLLVNGDDKKKGEPTFFFNRSNIYIVLFFYWALIMLSLNDPFRCNLKPCKRLSGSFKWVKVCWQKKIPSNLLMFKMGHLHVIKIILSWAFTKWVHSQLLTFPWIYLKT